MEIFLSHFLLCKVFDLTFSVGGNFGYFYLSDWWLATWNFALILDFQHVEPCRGVNSSSSGRMGPAVFGLGLPRLRNLHLMRVHVGLSLFLCGPGIITTASRWRKAPNIMMWCIPRKEPPGWARRARKKWANRRWHIHPGPNLEHCCQSFQMSKI